MDFLGIGSIVDGVGKVVDKLFTSDKERADAQITLERLKQQPYLMQAMINMAEAQHKSIFVAGWRPFIGWITGIGLLLAVIYGFVIQPILGACHIYTPPINTSELHDLIISMLGLSAIRSYDKVKGTTQTYGKDLILPEPKQTQKGPQ